MPISGLTIKMDNLKRIMESIQHLTQYDCLVGFPDSGAARNEPGAPTNAYIAFIQERGSPAANIPARPFMIPGINAVRNRAIKLLEKAALAALEGDAEKSRIILNQLGLLGVAAVQRAITVGAGWPALSPRTLAARRARGVTRTHPLIDTGQLRQHVEYVIRRNSRRRSLTGVEYWSSNTKRAA